MIFGSLENWLVDMRAGEIHVLLVEDINDHAELIQAIVTKQDEQITISRAATTEEAYETAQVNSFDLLLTDYQVGNEVCFELIEQLHMSGIELPIIILTGQGNEEVASEAFGSGAEDYLIKTEVFSKPELLIRSIRTAVERTRLQSALQESEELYRTLVQNLYEGVFVLREERLLFFNPSLQRILNIQEEQIGDLYFSELFTLEQRENVRLFIKQAAESGDPQEGEFTMIGPESNPAIYAALTVSKCIYDGEPALIGTVRDITARVEADRKLKVLLDEKERLSVTDELTGLYNRRFAMRGLEAEISRCQRYNSTMSLIMLDLDGFKAINDKLGHLSGDEALAAVAQVLKNELRESDIAARYGGDEFMLILPETGLERATVLAERVRKRVAENNGMLGEDTNLKLSISAGVAEFLKSGDSTADLIRRADGALLAAKSAGRNNVKVQPQ